MGLIDLVDPWERLIRGNFCRWIVSNTFCIVLFEEEFRRDVCTRVSGVCYMGLWEIFIWV